MPQINNELILLFLLVLTANVSEAVTGFGSTIIAVTIGAQLYGIDFLVSVLVPLNLILSTYIVVRYFGEISRTELFKRILPLAGIGLPIGMLLFNYIQGEPLKLVYGVFVLLFSLYQLWRISGPTGESAGSGMSLLAASPWLVAGGIMQGIYASGGPLIVFYAGDAIPDKGKFRATLSALWLILNVFVLAGHIYTGKTTHETLSMSVMLLPAVLIGIFLGDTLHKRIPEKTFRVFVFVLLVAAGASLAIKAAYIMFK